MNRPPQTKSFTEFVIGNDVRPVGRWYRFFFGIYLLYASVVDPALLSPNPLKYTGSYFESIGLYLLAIILAYIMLFYLIGDHIVAKTNPWIATVLFLSPLPLIQIFQIGPSHLRMALGIYIPLSLIVTSLIRYGGCEVVAIPTLLLRKRYTVYCPINALDIVENSISPTATGNWKGVIAKISVIVIMVVGGYFYIIKTQSLFGTGLNVDNRLSMLLLIPALYLTGKAWLTYRKEHRFSKSAGMYLLGALVIYAYISTLTSHFIQTRFFFAAAIIIGLLYSSAQFLYSFFLSKKGTRHDNPSR